MDDDVVDFAADGCGEALVAEASGDAAIVVDVLAGYVVEVLCCDAGLDGFGQFGEGL